MIAPNSLSEGYPINALYNVHELSMRYLIMMNFDPFLSPKVVNRWAYHMVSVVSPVKLISCSENGSIWLFSMPNCWNVNQ